MEAKDTVLKTWESSHLKNSDWDEGGGFFDESVKKALLEQAEVSFKAGQLDQAALGQLNFDKERVEFWNKIAEAHKAGIKEVVEWVEQSGDLYYNFPFRGIRKEAWQAFKKELGLWRTEISPYEIPHAAVDKYFTPPGDEE